MKPARVRRLPGLAIAALLVGGCGTAGTPSPAAPESTPAATATTAATSSAAPTPTDTPLTTAPAPTQVPTSTATPAAFACSQPVSRPGTVPTARITGLTVADDAGIGRITFTFEPSGNVAAVPQVEIRPVDPPFTKDPSGLPLAVAGSKFLRLVLQGGTHLDENMNPTYAGPLEFTTGGTPIVEMKMAGDFEAVSTFIIGVDGPPCVRVRPFDGQSRVVIEVRSGRAG